jgi:hypothetical protein
MSLISTTQLILASVNSKSQQPQRLDSNRADIPRSLLPRLHCRQLAHRALLVGSVSDVHRIFSSLLMLVKDPRPRHHLYHRAALPPPRRRECSCRLLTDPC